MKWSWITCEWSLKKGMKIEVGEVSFDLSHFDVENLGKKLFAGSRDN